MRAEPLAAHRPVSRSRCSGYRAPCTVICEAALVDLAQVVGRELDVRGAEVLLQAVQLRGARDRHDPRLLGEQPGERDLGRRRALPLGDAAEQVDQGLVRLRGPPA